jgi:sec-independent protein translocase protein TatB
MIASPSHLTPVLAIGMPGFWEMFFLAVLALLIFGPERLPKMAQQAGEMIAKFKREAAGTVDELKAAAELESFTGVARDLRATGEDLRRSIDLTAEPEKPRTAVMGGVVRAGPAPFDPDAP